MEEYFRLFNAITDAISALDALRESLMNAQLHAEDIYISRED